MWQSMDECRFDEVPSAGRGPANVDQPRDDQAEKVRIWDLDPWLTTTVASDRIPFAQSFGIQSEKWTY